MLLTSRAQFPRKLAPIFKPWRYKIIKGGRGSAKSWSVARALLQMGAQRKLEVICAREFQSSIRDSVHKLLKSQIEGMGLSALYRIERDVIYGPHGTIFVFVGLSDKTAVNLKSYEDFDICWVEEAQVLTRGSLDILTPTIRKPGSELWFTYNPQLDTDAIEVFANSLLPEECFIIDMNWRDNPWFNETLAKERERAERTMLKADYENIWNGKIRAALEGAIYAEEVAKLIEDRRYGQFPFDPFHLAHPIFDLGWNDKMSIIIAQRHISQLRIIDFIEDDHKTLDWYSRELRAKPYSYGTLFLPHDGGHGNAQTGKTDQQILEALGWRVHLLQRDTSVENGIRVGRMTFPQVYIDSTRCAGLLEHLRRYRRSVPKTTGEPGAPLHDDHSHSADAYRYACVAAPLMDDEGAMELPALNYPAARAV